VTETQNADLRARLEPFRRHWRLVTLIVLAISGVTYVYYARKPIQYTATSSVFVRFAGVVPIVGNDPETDPARRLTNEAQLVQTPPIASDVAQQLHYTGNPRNLLSLISVSPSSDSDYIDIAATTTNPEMSAAVANGFANEFAALSVARTKHPPLPGVESVDLATVPTAASGAAPVRYALFAGLLGLVLAVLLVKAMEAFDGRLRHPVVAAEYGLPLLASIPFSRKAQSTTRSRSRLPGAMTERVRAVRTMLEHTGDPGAFLRSVLITSAVSGEGKSTLTKSLALSYFESARSVLVIDADLRRPMLHEFFEAPLAPGLSDVLRCAIPLADSVQEVEPGEIEPALDPILARPAATAGSAQRETHPHRGIARGDEALAARRPVVHLLTSGSGTADPAALLGSAAFKKLLGEALGTYDVVLIDSPPVLAVSDVIPVAAAVDGVIVVARPESTTRTAVQRCREALEQVPGVNVVGVVANGVREHDEIARPYYLDRARAS